MVCDVVLVHTSDLHVDEDRRGGDGTAGLRSVLVTARAVRADIVLLAGDTFENNQLGGTILDRAQGCPGNESTTCGCTPSAT